jgi:hypothetical protein
MENGLVFHCLVSILIGLFEEQLEIITECKLAYNLRAGVRPPQSRNIRHL